MPLRDDFPLAGEEYLGGTSDGWEYRTVFSGTSLLHTYEMVQQFLEEEGYEDIPLPRNAEELLRFRIPAKNRQLLMFADNGYVHNPIKIIFPLDRRNKRTLTLFVYNENDADHLLKFHGLVEHRPVVPEPMTDESETEIETAEGN